MKKIFVLLFLLIAAIGAAQNGISYQAVLLNPNGEQLPGADNSKIPLVNSSICLRFSIAASSGGTPEYQETIITKTDAFGMVNVTIGTGNPTLVSPSFNTINWGSGPKNLKVELDLTGLCTSFITVSDQPFTSVPFALYALNSGSGGGSSTTTLTGDVSGTGTGTVATSIANNAVTTTKIADSNVTNAKLQNSSITINGNTVALGGTATINASPIGTALTSGNVLVGSASNLAAEVTMNGDVTISNTGATTIVPNAVTSAKIADANVTNAKLQNSSITINGNTVDLGGTATINASPVGTALTSGNVLIGSASNLAAEVTMNGDVTITNAGFTTIGVGKVDNSKLDKTNIPLSGFGVATADVDLGSKKLIGVADPTLAQDAATKKYVDAIIVDGITDTITSSAPTQNAVFDALTLKEDAANKSSDVNLSDALGIKFPTELAVKTFVETKVVDNINNGVTSSAPTQNAVFDALTLKEDAANKSSDVNLSDALGIKFPTELAVKTFVETKVVDNINNGVTSSAPTQNAVFDALTLKEDAANKSSDVNLSDTLGIKFPTELAVKTFVETKVVDNINNGVTSSAPTQNAVFDALTLKEDAANKSSDVTLSDISGAKFPTELAVKTFVETKVVDNINNGVISSAPTQNAVYDALALKEDAANKSSDVTLSDISGAKFPTESAVKTYVDNQIASEAPNATTILNGKIRLAGDLAGTGTTATAPVISDNAITSAKISNGTITNADISNTAAIQTSKIKGFYSGITNIDVLNNAGDVNIPIGSGGLNITEGVTKNATIIFQNNGSQDIYVKFAKLTGAVNPDGITYNFIKVGFNYDSGNYSGKLEFSYIIILNN